MGGQISYSDTVNFDTWKLKMINHTGMKHQSNRIVGKTLCIFFWCFGLLSLVGGVIGLFLL